MYDIDIKSYGEFRLQREIQASVVLSVDVRGWCWVAIVNINNRLIIRLQTMNQR